MGLLDRWVNQAKSTLKDYVGAQNTGFIKNATTTDPTLTSGSRRFIVTIKQDQDVPTLPGMGKDPMIVVGQISQDFTIDQAVKWDAPWGAGLIGDPTIANVLALTGNRLVSQVLTLQVWQGAGNDIDFTVAFELRAWSDTTKDVILPLQYLLAMSMPSLNDAGFLRSPGPILDEKAFEEFGQAIPKTISDIGNAGVNFIGNIAGAVTGKTSDGASNALSAVRTFGTDVAKALPNKQSFSDKMKNKISISIGSWFKLDNIVITNVQHTLKPQMVAGDGGLMAADVTVSFRPMFALTAADIPSLLKTPGTGVISADGTEI